MKQLDESRFHSQLNHRLEDKTFEELLLSLIHDPATNGHEPEGRCQLDPRDGSMIIYAGKRASRPDQTQSKTLQKGACPICDGQLTQVVDYAPLSEGFSFISQNLFPIVMAHNPRPNAAAQQSLYLDPDHYGRAAFGTHLLQWSSSIHDRDWHNMPIEDINSNLQRLAVLEKSLLKGGKNFMPPSHIGDDLYGYVSIIKNFGANAGASLSHGHQQIAYSNIMPQQAFNNMQFFGRHSKSIARYLIKENPDKLTVEDNAQLKVVVPYFMRRPSNILILIKTEAHYLHQLTDEERFATAKAIKKVIRGLMAKFEARHKDTSFNLAFHSGPGCTFYIEFYPILQTSGGFEKIGLWICQESPETAAEEMRAIFCDIDRAS